MTVIMAMMIMGAMMTAMMTKMSVSLDSLSSGVDDRGGLIVIVACREGGRKGGRKGDTYI